MTDPNRDAVERPKQSLILLKGGHRVFAQGVSPVDLEHAIREHVLNNAPGEGFYVQAINHPDNGIVIYPSQVVAIVVRNV